VRALFGKTTGPMGFLYHMTVCAWVSFSASAGARIASRRRSRRRAPRQDCKARDAARSRRQFANRRLLRIHGGLTRRCTRRGAVRWPGTDVAYLLLNLHGVTAHAVRSRLCYR